MTTIIIVIVVAVLLVIGGIIAIAVTRGGGNTPSPTESIPVVVTTSTQPTTQPTTEDTTFPYDTDFPFPTINNSPFCIAYMSFNETVSDYSSYQDATDSKDWKTADTYMTKYLAAAKDMQSAGPPADMKDDINTIVNYFDKVHKALQKGGLSGVSSTDDLNYFTAYLSVIVSGATECYGG